MTGRKQQKTTSPAAIHLNMIFRTDPKGISKSITDTRCDDDNAGGGAGGTGGSLATGGGNCVPYFSIGKQSSIVFHSSRSVGLHDVFRSTRLSANICATS